MENPCDKCIIKVNCTEVCLPKKNYGVLLKSGADSHWKLLDNKTLPNRTYYWNQYRKLTKQLNDHWEDESIISMRSFQVKSEF